MFIFCAKRSIQCTTVAHFFMHGNSSLILSLIQFGVDKIKEDISNLLTVVLETVD